MPAQLQALRRRIRSIRSTKKITKAQELVATSRIGEWWDLVAVAGMSLVVYYWARATAMPREKVQAAVAEVESEASIELESHLVS